MKRVFLIGSPRSGTTWLQLLLAQEAAIATSSETHLFTQYLNLLETRWQHEKSRAAAGHKVNGLSQVLDDEQFYGLLRKFSDGVFDSISGSKPNASILVEKTPEHALYPELIFRVFPDAYFIHIIRDPRAVANSFYNAAKTWWTRTQSGPYEATQRWMSNVIHGKKFGQLSSCYLEVKYEDLTKGGASELFRILTWLSIETDEKRCKKSVSACEIDKLRAGADGAVKPWPVEEEPEGFFRKGDSNAWESEMSSSRIAVVEYVARDIMTSLGYKPVAKGNYVGLMRIGLYKLLRNIYKAMTYVCDGFVRRMERGMSRL